MEPQVRYAKTSDGVNIAWYAIGTGWPYVWPASPPSSAVIGWRIPELRNILEGIARRARLVTYDPRGFGLSDREAVDFSCESSALDLEAVAEAASLERFTIQAFGTAAMPALIYAAWHPERVLRWCCRAGLCAAPTCHRAGSGWFGLPKRTGRTRRCLWLR